MGEVNRRKPKITEVNEQEKVFCDHILNGGLQCDAVFKAGYYPIDLLNDKAYRKKATHKAAELLKKYSVSVYMNKNKNRTVMSASIDRRALLYHVYDIAMGSVTKTSYLDGEEIQEPPSFSDQIAAAKLFFAEEQKQMKDASIGFTPAESTSSVISVEAKRLLSKYQLKEVVTTDVFERHPEIVENAEFVEAR